MRCCICKDVSHKTIDCPLSWNRHPLSAFLDTQSEDPPNEDPLPADSQEHPPPTTDATENLRPDPSDIPSEEDTLPSDDDVPLLAAVTDVTLADQPASSADRVTKGV